MWSIFRRKPKVIINEKIHVLKVHFKGVTEPRVNKTVENSALVMYKQIVFWFSKGTSQVEEFSCHTSDDVTHTVVLERSSINAISLKEDHKGTDFETN